MERRIGEEGLGELARSQIEAARTDQRLGRKRGAMVADFWDGIEEAKRVRMLGMLGLHELKRPQLQAAWERSELARIEVDNGSPSPTGESAARGLLGLSQ